MDELTTATEPLNPYARTFFWLWGLAVLALVGFRAEDPAYREQVDGWHRHRIEWLAELHAFATCPIPPKQNRLTVRVVAGEKKYGDH